MAKHSVLHTFYNSKEWKKFRLNLIEERGPKCERCKKVIANPIEIIGHHKQELTPENVRDYNISLDPDKVELICHGCHNKEHLRFTKVEKKVYIVYGAPMAGKKTYVREQKGRGDLVIDMDALYSAVTMLPMYDKPDMLLNNVRTIHNALLDNIKTRFGKWHTAWIIGGYADKYKRDKLAEDLGAELIHIESSKEECYYRLNMDTDRQHRIDEWKGYIDKWFTEYTV